MSAADTLIHPRERLSLRALEPQSSAFSDALARGRLHHAWLLCGPEGSGKASFAYLAARRLLGAVPDPGLGALASLAGDPVCRMVAARSHPDLLVLERGEEVGARKTIPVEEARRLAEFFSKSPAVARRRVAIVDCADDLNANAANALLKTLEEPSGEGVILLVSHAPGRLLATLRSRCRRLTFPPWSSQDLIAFLRDTADLEGVEASRVAEAARGTPGRALALHLAGERRPASALAGLLKAPPGDGDSGELLAMADSFRGGEGASRFDALLQQLADGARDAAAEAALAGSDGDPWSAAWARVNDLRARAEALNLDRHDVFWTLVGDLRRVAGLPASDAARC